MTEDEAVKIAKKTFEDAGGTTPINFRASIRTYAALGMIKLDPPKTVIEKATEALKMDGYEPSYMFAALDKAGFKIVEK